MLGSLALISILSAFAFLSVAYYFRREIAEKMRPPQRVPVVIRVDEPNRKNH